MRVVLDRHEIVMPVETRSSIVERINHDESATSVLGGTGGPAESIHEHLSAVTEPSKVNVYSQPGQ